MAGSKVKSKTQPYKDKNLIKKMRAAANRTVNKIFLFISVLLFRSWLHKRPIINWANKAQTCVQLQGSDQWQKMAE